MQLTLMLLKFYSNDGKKKRCFQSASCHCDCFLRFGEFHPCRRWQLAHLTHNIKLETLSVPIDSLSCSYWCVVNCLASLLLSELCVRICVHLYSAAWIWHTLWPNIPAVHLQNLGKDCINQDLYIHEIVTVSPCQKCETSEVFAPQFRGKGTRVK